MPRIVAETVSENREYRMAALRRAGAALLVDGGSFTVESVTAEVGISRSSFYEYFSSCDALAASIVDDEVAALAAELAPTADGIADPRARVRMWVRNRLLQTGSRGQRLLDAVRGPGTSDEPLDHPLRQSLEDAGVDDIDQTAEYLVALVAVGMRRIERGESTADAESAAMMRILDPLLGP